MWHGIVLSAWFILVYLDMDGLCVICKKCGGPLGKVKEKRVQQYSEILQR